MVDQPDVPDEHVSTRADLLPEEKEAGSDDPEAQAEAVLAESEERTRSRNAAPSTHLEKRSSDEATPPAD